MKQWRFYGVISIFLLLVMVMGLLFENGYIFFVSLVMTVHSMAYTLWILWKHPGREYFRKGVVQRSVSQ